METITTELFPHNEGLLRQRLDQFLHDEDVMGTVVSKLDYRAN
jgi:hypothetical protein